MTHLIINFKLIEFVTKSHYGQSNNHQHHGQYQSRVEPCSPKAASACKWFLPIEITAFGNSYRLKIFSEAGSRLAAYFRLEALNHKEREGDQRLVEADWPWRMDAKVVSHEREAFRGTGPMDQQSEEPERYANSQGHL